MNQDRNTRELLKSGAEELGVPLTDHQLDQFERFTALLLEWNEKFNITRISDPEEIVIRHYLDSLSILSAVKIPGGASLIDVGTGGGIPGIPLKIAIPELRLTLLDSVRKKLTFAEVVAADLALKDVRFVHARAEDAGRDKALRGRFDFCVSRAVARLNVLAELCLPFCRIGGKWVAYKGPEADEEIAEAQKAIKMLGGEMIKVRKLILPSSDQSRTLIVVKKIHPTFHTFPRKAGTPQATPL
jgi:16S rRNA (guanine527-N7)-methyltransferase